MGLVGVYTSQQEIYDKGWKTIEFMKEEIGLNLLILGGGSRNINGSINFLLGSGIPYDIGLKAPFKAFTYKKDKLKGLIEEAHKRDIDVWLSPATFAEMDNKGTTFPDLHVRDIDGKILPPVCDHGFAWSWSWCPSNPKLHEFYAYCYKEMAKRYNLDGFSLTHLRFSPLGNNFYHFFGCGCPNCIKAAETLGYDFERMKKSLKKLLRRLKSLDSKRIKSLRKLDMSLLDWLYWLGSDTSVIDWINFRCDLITHASKKFYDACKEGNENVKFAIDNFPPSFAQLVGHRYGDFESNLDFLSPLLPHPIIFTILNFVEIANKLLEWNKGLAEADVLKLLYNLFGYSNLGLPDSLERIIDARPMPSSDYQHKYIDIPRIYELEASKARAITNGKKPMYGIVAATRMVPPEGTAQRAGIVLDTGMQGVIIQIWGLPGREENLKALGKILREKHII